jgi:subfamily B ATP-binding cassette protein MsbA
MEQYLKVFRFGWPFLRRYRLRFFCGILLGFCFAGTSGLFIWAAQVLTARVLSGDAASLTLLGNADPSWIARLTPGFIETLAQAQDFLLPLRGQPLTPGQIVGGLLFLPLLGALRGLLDYGTAYCMAWVSSRTVLDIQSAVLRCISTMSLGYFTSSRLGDHILRIQSDTGVLQKTLNLGMSDLIKEPCTLLVVLVSLLLTDWKLTLLALLFYPAYGLAIYKVGRKTRRLAEKNLKPAIAQGSQLIEYLANIRLVKAYRLEDFQLARFVKNGREQIGYLIKRIQAQEILNPIVETLAMLGASLTILYVVWADVGSDTLVGFLTGLIILMKPIKKIAGLHVTFKNASVSVDRVAEALTMQPDIVEPTQPVSKPSFDRALSFRAVSFAYGNTPVLHQLDLEIPKGTKLGIVGESGSGKSTLINLLMRFYDPQSGRIEIDSTPLSCIATTDLRRLMALVSQEVAIFDMTVAENIALGRQDARRADIEEAARRADAHTFITALPQGYDTRVGESGATLSGGQRQRIAIARALVRNSPILLLDEATAALDSKSEAEVQAALDRLSGDYTVIAVAHRLSSLRNFDRILVMENGRIVEEGAFPELMARGGRFAAMAARQGLAS